jgi:hypothetical protein
LLAIQKQSLPWPQIPSQRLVHDWIHPIEQGRPKLLLLPRNNNAKYLVEGVAPRQQPVAVAAAAVRRDDDSDTFCPGRHGMRNI